MCYGATMKLHIFKSGKEPDVFGFTADATGGNLPSELGPWLELEKALRKLVQTPQWPTSARPVRSLPPSNVTASMSLGAKPFLIPLAFRGCANDPNTPEPPRSELVGQPDCGSGNRGSVRAC